MTSNLQRMIDNRGWTVPELARRSSVSPQTLRAALKGKRTVSKSTWLKIADALGVSYPMLTGQLRVETAMLEEEHIQVMLDYLSLSEQRQALVRQLLHELS